MNKKLVFGFLDDNLTSIQRKSLEQWLKDPANEEDFYTYLNEYEKENTQYVVDVESRLVEVKEQRKNQVKDRDRPLISNWPNVRNWGIGLSAAVVFIIFSGVLLTYYNEKSVSGLMERLTYLKHDKIEEINNTLIPRTVMLPDNSSVILQPESKLVFSTEDFKKGKRVVFFEGKGFFEVQKDSKAPFIVNTNDFSTRVLGTSFSVKTAKNSAENEVIVKTGKVAVFKAERITGAGQAIFLSANQKVHFPKGFRESLVSVEVSEKDLKDKIESVSFEFDERPVSEVFEMLSAAYHVNIDYEKEEMKNCKITAFLTDEPLYEKIRLICFALDAKFEFKNKTILIMSNGC